MDLGTAPECLTNESKIQPLRYQKVQRHRRLTFRQEISQLVLPLPRSWLVYQAQKSRPEIKLFVHRHIHYWQESKQQSVILTMSLAAALNGSPRIRTIASLPLDRNCTASLELQVATLKNSSSLALYTCGYANFYFVMKFVMKNSVKFQSYSGETWKI